MDKVLYSFIYSFINNNKKESIFLLTFNKHTEVFVRLISGFQ